MFGELQNMILSTYILSQQRYLSTSKQVFNHLALYLNIRQVVGMTFSLSGIAHDSANWAICHGLFL